MARSFYIATLGCKVNQYESQSLREAWAARGMVEAVQAAEASVILVHSCAITAKAVADVRATVRKLHKAAPQASIIVAGCAAQVAPAEFEALPGVVKVLGQQEKPLLLQGPSRFLGDAAQPLDASSCSGRPAQPCGIQSADGNLVASPTSESSAQPVAALAHPSDSDALSADISKKASPYPPFTISGYDRSRAILKIQDGCSHGCTYCIVPFARGPARSRPFDDALEEARTLLAAGFREIVINGVNLRQYHDPTPSKGSKGKDFWAFLRRLDAALAPEWSGVARFRLSSLEPGQLGEQALEAFSACRMVAPQLHLSLQSGSFSVLQRMNRGHYSPATLPEFFSRLKAIWPVFGLGADILTSFPGETEQEFSETVDCCAALPLSYAHVFPYSKRPGTVAAAMQEQIPAEVKKHRAAILRDIVLQKKEAFLHSLLSLPTMQVVFEDREQGASVSGKAASLRGVNEFYADCRADASLQGALTCALVPVAPVAVEKGVLIVGKTEAALP